MQTKHYCLGWLALAFGFTGLSCNVGVSAPRLNPDGTPAPPSYCARGTTQVADGLIDDLEDGNNRVEAIDGRGGYWWKSADATGSTIEPNDNVGVTPPGGDSLAFHAYGETVSGGGDDNWGAQFGADFKSEPGYDASRYVGIRFRAKIGPESSPSVRFMVSDVNTHPKLGVCQNCWNHFGRELNLSEEWQELEFMFSALEQEAGWGDPRPPSLTPANLYGLAFKIGPGKKFDVWIDDIEFIACK